MVSFLLGTYNIHGGLYDTLGLDYLFLDISSCASGMLSGNVDPLTKLSRQK